METMEYYRSVSYTHLDVYKRQALSSSDARRLKFLKWSTFLSATFGYGMYYVCRLSLNVVKKQMCIRDRV